MGNAEEHGLNRDGNLPFHFFGGPGRILGDHFDQRWRRIGIRLDVEPQEHVDAAGDPGDQQRQSSERR